MKVRIAINDLCNYRKTLTTSATQKRNITDVFMKTSIDFKDKFNNAQIDSNHRAFTQRGSRRNISLHSQKVGDLS